MLTGRSASSGRLPSPARRGSLLRRIEDMAERKFRVLVQVQVIEQAYGFSGTDRIWSERMMVVPLERIAALDPGALVEQAVKDVVHVAGQKEEAE